MKKKLIGLFACLSTLALASCGDAKEETKKTVETTTVEETKENTTTKETTTSMDNNEDTYEWAGDYLTLDELKGRLYKNTEAKFYDFTEDSFQNKLKKPTSEITALTLNENIALIADAMDYSAFYHLDTLELSFQNAESENSIREMIYQGYWASKLLVSVVNFTFEIRENKALITFIYNEEANSYIAKEEEALTPTGIPYTFYSTLDKRDEENDTFAYMSYTNGTVDVYNSDQLLYVLENKYIPNPLPNSPAEKVLSKAKEILNSIIYDDMSLLDKEIAIHSWILSHASYSQVEGYAFYKNTKDSSNPDKIMSMLQGAYIEGVLFGGEGVCHGFAKTLSLLSSIEGIDNVKVSAPHIDMDYKHSISPFVDIDGIRSYQSHGYVYVKDPETGLLYINDPTFAFFYSFGTNYCYRELAIMKAYTEWTKIYESQEADFYQSQNEASMATTDMGYKDAFLMKVDDITMDLNLTSEEEIDTFNSYLNGYISSYTDTNYRTTDYLTLNAYASDDVFSYAYNLFNSPLYSLPLLRYSQTYPDLGFSFMF